MMIIDEMSVMRLKTRFSEVAEGARNITTVNG